MLSSRELQSFGSTDQSTSGVSAAARNPAFSSPKGGRRGLSPSALL